MWLHNIMENTPAFTLCTPYWCTTPEERCRILKPMDVIFLNRKALFRIFPLDFHPDLSQYVLPIIPAPGSIGMCSFAFLSPTGSRLWALCLSVMY